MNLVPSRLQKLCRYGMDSSAIYNETIEDRDLHTFCDKCTYLGNWDQLGMHGTGVFTFVPHEVVHDGSIRHGKCHGSGELIYPSKAKFQGRWEDGHLVHHRYYYMDTKYNPDYLKMPDRRFIKEIKCGLRPAGRSYLTNDYPSPKIPPNCYDAGDGFYNPKTKCVTSYKDPKKIIRIPTKTEHDFILANCRKAWDTPVGYRPDLYENWDESCVCGCICPKLPL